MAMTMLVRGAVAVATARALTLESGRRAEVDLPRTVVEANEQDGCGSNLTGYLITGRGLMWSDFVADTARDLTDCRKKCDSAKNCVGFSARYPRKGPMQCNRYHGLIKKNDKKAMSYVKCAKGLRCSDSDGMSGFQFSHPGTWTYGEKYEATKISHCFKQCRKDRSCIAFTHRSDKKGTGECYHFKNSANEAGPKRDMRATTYSKCVLTVQKTPETPAEQAPSLPLSMAVMPKSGNAACDGSYVGSSKGWWWSDYDKLTEVGDSPACAKQCDSLEKCVSFVYRPFDKKGECYLYKGLTAIVDPTLVAFTKCRPGGPCRGDSRVGNGEFEFSHGGTWEGGDQISDVTVKSCALICQNDEACSAVSWKREGEVCSTFKFKLSSKAPMAAAGAEGYAKCTSVDADPQRLF